MSPDLGALCYTASAITIAALIIYRLRQTAGAKYTVPWAKTKTWIPLIGHVLEYGADPVKFLNTQKELVGDVFRVNLIIMNITFMIGARWNRWLLRETTEEDVSFFKVIPVLSCGLIGENLYHSGWVEHTLKALGLGLNRPERLAKATEISAQMASTMYEDWTDLPSVPLFAQASKLLLRANLVAYLGHRFVQLHESELISMVESYQKALVNPWCRLLPLWASPSGRMLQAARARMEGLIKLEAGTRLKDPQGIREADDYLSFLLSLNAAEGFEESYKEYAAHFGVYIIASHVNTTGIFAWTLLHLLKNPDLLSAFEDEIANNPPVEDGIYPLNHMPFSEACLRETGRLYGNLVALRYAPSDICTPDGTIIPKGWVATSPLAVHHDPELYEEPGKWNPWRFLPSEDGTPSNYANLFRNTEFVQFGVGRHSCPGERMTHSLLRGSLWPALLDNYRLELVDGLVEGEGVDGVGVKPNHGESLGTPYGIREVSIKVTKRIVPLSAKAEN